MAKELSGELQCSVDLPAIVILGLVSLIGSRYRCTVRARPNWVEGTNLYLAVAIPPGGSKSPVFRRLTSVLAGLEEQLRLTYESELLAHNVDLELCQAEQKQLKKMSLRDGSAGSTESLRDVRSKEMFLADQRPRPPRLTVSDATPESIIGPLEDNAGRIAVFSAEATIFGNLARYSSSTNPGKANIDVYLAGHSGDRYEVDRRSRDRPIILPEVRIVMTVLTQPEPLHEVLADPTNLARGFVDRLLVSEPEHFIGYRRYLGHDAQVSELTAAEYQRNMQGLIDALAFEQGRDLLLTPEAIDAFDAWRDEMEVARLGRLAVLAGMPEKLHSAAVRLAGLLHLASASQGNEVGLSAMTDAIRITNYFRGHALRMVTQGELERLERDAVRVAEWISAEGRQEFSLRDLARFGPVREKSDRLAEVLERLEAAGTVRLPRDDGRAGSWWDTGHGRPSPVIEVVS